MKTIIRTYIAINLLFLMWDVQAQSEKQEEGKNGFYEQLDREVKVIAKAASNIDFDTEILLHLTRYDDLPPGDDASMLVALAAKDTDLDASKFQKKFPSLWKYAHILAIEDLDEDGKKEVLFQNVLPNLVSLLVVEPHRELKNKGESAAHLRLQGTARDDLIELIPDGKRLLIKVTHQGRPFAHHDPDPKRTFFQTVTMVGYDGKELKVLSSKKEELPEEQFKMPSNGGHKK